MSFGTKEKDDPPTNGEECDEGVARKEQEPPIPIAGSKRKTSQGHWPDVYTGKAGKAMSGIGKPPTAEITTKPKPKPKPTAATTTATTTTTTTTAATTTARRKKRTTTTD